MHTNTVNLKFLFRFLFLYKKKKGILALRVICVEGVLKTLKKYIIIFYGEKSYSLFMILFINKFHGEKITLIKNHNFLGISFKGEG